MKLQIVQSFSCTPEVLMRALTAPRFHLDLAQRSGVVSCELLEHVANGKTHILRIRRCMRNRTPVPAVLAKLTPQMLLLTRRDEWDTVESTGRIEIELEKVPARMSAGTVVVPTASGCEQHFNWEIRASAPLIGGLVEKFIAQDLAQTLQSEVPIMSGLLPAYARE